MQKITCNVEEPYFSYLLEGTKQVEGRILKGKWEMLSQGDILLCSSGLHGTVVEFEVIGMITAPSFEALYEMCGTRLLPNNPKTAWEVYSQWFSKEDEYHYGVIGIELRRLTY